MRKGSRGADLFPLEAASSKAGAPEDESSAALARFKHLTEVVLPALARDGQWPIRFDHCFKRICLDHAFDDVWYRHLSRPAERHLYGEPLERAVRCAEELAAGGLPVLAERNRASLGYRGRLRR